VPDIGEGRDRPAAEHYTCPAGQQEKAQNFQADKTYKAACRNFVPAAYCIDHRTAQRHRQGKRVGRANTYAHRMAVSSQQRHRHYAAANAQHCGNHAD